MTTYISILRGINVSGQKKVPMKELQAVYVSVGLHDVQTYIQSGNVVFQTEEQSLAALAKKIEQAISTHFGFDVPVLIRTGAEMSEVLTSNPFVKETGIEADKLHVTFLDEQPGSEALEKLLTYDYPPDRFIVQAKEVFVYCPNGYGRTKLTNTFFETN